MMGACKVCGKMNCYAHGGDVHRERPHTSEGQKGWVHDKDHNKGVHRETGGGESYAGSVAKRGHTERAKELHRDKLAESRSLPKPKLKGLAHGGMPEEAPDLDVSLDDHDMDDIDNELNDMAAQELMDALEKKDKKAVLESIRALVMYCGGKV